MGIIENNVYINKKYFTNYVEKVKAIACRIKVKIFSIQGLGQTIKAFKKTK